MKKAVKKRGLGGLRTPLSLAAVLGLCALALHFLDIDPNAILQALSRFSLSSIGAALILLFGQTLFLVLRFWVLMPPSQNVGLRDTAYAVAMGHIANSLLPARAGDALRIVLLGRQGTWGSRLDMATGTGVLAADKIIDISSLLALAGLLGVHKVPGISLLPSLLAWGWLALGVVVVTVAIGFRTLVRKNPQGRLAQLSSSFGSGIKGALTPRSIFLGVLCGFMVWFTESLALQALCNALGFPFSVTQALFGLIVLNVLIAIPVSVASVGTYEASLAFGLNLMGTDAISGIAIATAHHLLQVINAGVFSMAWVGYKRLTLRLKPLPPEEFGGVFSAEQTRAALSRPQAVLSAAHVKELIPLATLDLPEGWALALGPGVAPFVEHAKANGMRVHIVGESAHQVMPLYPKADEVEIASLAEYQGERRYDRLLCLVPPDGGQTFTPESLRRWGELLSPRGKALVVFADAGKLPPDFQTLCETLGLLVRKIHPLHGKTTAYLFERA